MTAIEDLACLSCGSYVELSPALAVCTRCQSAAVQRVHAALAAENLPSGSWALTDAALLVEAGVGYRSEQETRPRAVEGPEELARHRGRLVWLLADQVTDLEAQLAEIGKELDAAGYAQLAVNDLEALQVALADAAQAQHAGDIIAGNEALFDDDDIAEALHQAVAVMGEHERVLEQLYEHQVWSGGDPVVEVVQDVVVSAAQAERARELLMEARRMQDTDDVPAAVLRLIEDARQSQEDLARERQRTLQLASISRRLLLDAHVGAHPGEIDNCPSCGPDWAAVRDSYVAFD
ncbi:hypothetical protein [Blastococcus montanus]|uniref:hypothetical protein n=1 Tax=Blastococcus montanus TaxID=3144973 RepID=UPI00320AD507